MKASTISVPQRLGFIACVLAALLLQASPSRAQVTPVDGIAREFTVTNHANSQPIRMSDFAGKVLVLDFFAYWCGPCQASSPDLEQNVQEYYAARGGNANGVPVQCLAISIDDSNPALTEAFIRNAGIQLSGEDPMTSAGAWGQFNVSGGIPLFVIINCVEGSPSHQQYQVLYKQAGYAGAAALRTVIDRVMPAPEPGEISVESPEGELVDNGPGYSFGDIRLGGGNVERTFTIRNTAANPLRGLDVTKDGADAGDFRIDATGTAGMLQGGSSTTFRVTFSPSASGNRNAVIRIASNDSDENPFDIRVAGTGVTGPEIEVRNEGSAMVSGNSELGFGRLFVGGEPTERTIEIVNLGNEPLTGLSVAITGVQASDFAVVTPPAGSLAPGGSTMATFRFRPTASGTRIAGLRINSNDADEDPFLIRLTGTGELRPELEVRSGAELLESGSAELGFGNVDVGGTGISRTIVLGNVGNAPLQRVSVSLTGSHAADFEVTTTPEPEVAPQDTTGITIRFNPTVAGSRTATLRINSNDADENPFEIQLFGIALAGTGPELEVQSNGAILGSASPPVSFGAAMMGGQGPESVISIGNVGNAPLSGISVTLGGIHASDFQLVGFPASTIASGASTAVTVRFNPTGSGNRNATLRITSNDADESTFEIRLTGVGESRPEIEVRSNNVVLVPPSAELAFENSSVGPPGPTRTIVIGNVGNAALSGLSFSFLGRNASDFSVAGFPNSAVAVGQSISVTVRFTPSASGPRVATLRIGSNDADENPFDIRLSGAGEGDDGAPDISISEGRGPERILISGRSNRNLGSSRIGVRGGIMTFRMKNAGTKKLKGLREKFVGKDAKDFVFVKKIGVRALDPGQTATFKIALQPRKTGVRKAVLQVLSNDRDESPFIIRLQGRGTSR